MRGDCTTGLGNVLKTVSFQFSTIVCMYGAGQPEVQARTHPERFPRKTWLTFPRFTVARVVPVFDSLSAGLRTLYKLLTQYM